MSQAQLQKLLLQVRGSFAEQMSELLWEQSHRQVVTIEIPTIPGQMVPLFTAARVAPQCLPLRDRSMLHDVGCF